MSNVEQIRRVLADRVEAMRSGDVDALVAPFTDEVVKFDLAPPLQQVGPEVRDVDALRAWFVTFDGPVDYEITDLAVTAGDDVAYCHSLNRLAATPVGSSEGFELWFRSTVGLRKADGAWRITHEHASTPFYMDGSFLAATDLKP
jgi:ketosteroid isomerase-like protein